MKPQKVMLFFGPRRVGKTFLLKQIVQSFKGKSLMLNGEDADSIAMLEPISIANYCHVLEGMDLLAIDEAQHIPDIGKKLKLIVDEVPGIRVILASLWWVEERSLFCCLFRNRRLPRWSRPSRASGIWRRD